MFKRSVDEQKKLFVEKIARFCDKCGCAYHLDDVQIIQENQSSAIIHFSCRNCKSNNIANLVSPLGFTTRTPLNCDLTVKEFTNITEKETVSLDDILEIHMHFEDNKGCVKL